MKRILLMFTLLITIQPVFSQNAGIDNMLQKIAAEKDDNRRFDIIYNALVKIGETDPLLGLQYAQKLQVYAQNKKDKISEAYALSFMSKMYTVSGNLEKGLKYGLQGKELAEHTGNQKMISLSYSLLGLNYKNLSDFPKPVFMFMIFFLFPFSFVYFFFFFQIKISKKRRYIKNEFLN